MDNNEIEQLKNTYPSNSKSSKKNPQPEPKPEDKKVQKVISGSVKTKKRGLGKRMADIFLEDNTKTVGSYIIHDVLIPAAKSMICDMIGWGGFAEILLFGDKRGGRTRRDGGRTNTPYGSFFRSSDRDGRDRDRRDISKAARSRHDFDEITFETRGEAEDVLSHLCDLIIEYDQATVTDLYTMVGLDHTWMDDKYGWTDLRSASTSRLRDGYVINLPRTQYLE